MLAGKSALLSSQCKHVINTLLLLVDSGVAYDVEDNKTNAYDDIVSTARQNSTANNSKGDRPDGVTDLSIIMWATSSSVVAMDHSTHFTTQPTHNS